MKIAGRDIADLDEATLRAEAAQTRALVRRLATDAAAVEPVYELGDERDTASAMQLVRHMITLAGLEEGGDLALRGLWRSLPADLIIEAARELDEMDPWLPFREVRLWAQAVVTAAFRMASDDAVRTLTQDVWEVVSGVEAGTDDRRLRDTNDRWEEFLVRRSLAQPRGWAAGNTRLSDQLRNVTKRHNRRLKAVA